MGAINSSDKDTVGSFYDGIMHEVGKLRYLGTANVVKTKGSKMRIALDRF